MPACNPIVIKLEILRLVRLVTFFNRPTSISLKEKIISVTYFYVHDVITKATQ